MVLPSSWIIVALWILAIVSTVVAFVISLISRVILALYIAIGPLLIAASRAEASLESFERADRASLGDLQCAIARSERAGGLE